ncbi:MAG: BolA/IbaG family iron-sulfur metabolism protein [archaeon]|nr:BolA/IbaG family iron-sulfur metabolism protein [archaeon]
MIEQRSYSSRPERLTKLVQTALQTDQVQVYDDSPDGNGGHVEIEVVSPLFAGKSRLQQHRMVNEAVAPEMTTIHALHVRTAISNS